MNKKLYAGISQIVLGILIAIAPQTFAHVCAVKETPMACHYTAQAALGIGIVIVALGIVGLFVSDQTRAGLDHRRADRAHRRVQGCHDALPYGHLADADRARRAAGCTCGNRGISRSQAGEARLTQYDATHHPWRVAPGQSQTQTVSYRGAHHRCRHAYRGLLWWFTAVHEP